MSISGHSRRSHYTVLEQKKVWQLWPLSPGRWDGCDCRQMCCTCIWVGTPAPGRCWVKGHVSVWLQVHENENILAISNKKKIQYQKLGAYRMLGPSGRES